jgi:hypothetical protein
VLGVAGSMPCVKVDRFSVIAYRGIRKMGAQVRGYSRSFLRSRPEPVQFSPSLLVHVGWVPMCGGPAGGREGAPEDSRGPKKQNVQSNAGHKDQVPIQRAASRYLGKGQKVEAFKP